MSLYRMVTRIAAVSALNNYLQKPWPTMVGPNVFDSKIEPVEDMVADRAFPCIVVYTDYDKDHWTKGGGAFRHRLLSLTFELLVVQAQQMPRSSTWKLTASATDSELETALDVLESQIYRALSRGTEASDAFNYLCPTYTNVISRRGSSTEGGSRLAARQITLEMQSIREPAAGIIPPDIEAFLSKVESFPDYAERIPDIRSLLSAPAGDTDYERTVRTLGYTRRLTTQLGGAADPSAVLPPAVTYNIGG